MSLCAYVSTCDYATQIHDTPIKIKGGNKVFCLEFQC